MGTPLPSALAIVTTSGTTPRRWWANQAPQRPRPVCTSSTMKRIAALVAEPADALEVLGGRGVHPALALHRLEQHGGDRRVERRLERVEVVPGDVAEALGERLERLVLGRLPGGVQGGEGAAVEGAEGADHHVAAPAAEPPGQLEGALVGLGAGVGEEHLAPQCPVGGPAGLAGAEQAVEGAGHLPARLGAEEVGDVQQRLRLLVQGRRRPRGGCGPGW